MTKRCSKCKNTKDLSEFYKNSSKKDGVTTACKVCINTRSKMKYESKTARKIQLKYKYGIDDLDFLDMLYSQQNLCAICFTEIDTKAHVDHSHDTGKIRGLLCMRCNVGIGMFQDDPHTLKSAANYVERHRI